MADELAGTTVDPGEWVVPSGLPGYTGDRGEKGDKGDQGWPSWTETRASFTIPPIGEEVTIAIEEPLGLGVKFGQHSHVFANPFENGLELRVPAAMLRFPERGNTSQLHLDFPQNRSRRVDRLRRWAGKQLSHPFQVCARCLHALANIAILFWNFHRDSHDGGITRLPGER